MQTNNLHIKQAELRLYKDEHDFDRIYLDHYSVLYQYAFTMISDGVIAEEMVHQVFLKILERDQPVIIHTSLKAYLYRSVNHECLNYLKHQKVKYAFQVHVQKDEGQIAENPAGKLQYRELEQQLKIAINDLPEQCRTIFQLSRFEELKYTEIASQLGLSVKTVETQISRALKKLRIQLADYLPFILWPLLTNMLYLNNYLSI